MMATAQQVQMWNCKTLEFIRRNKKHLLVNSQIWRLCGSRFQMWRRAGCWYSTLRLRQWHLSANNDQLFNYLSPEEYFGHKVLYSSAPRSKNAQPQTVKMNALRRRQMHVGHVVWRTALITCKDSRLPCFKLARLSFSKEIRCVYKDDPSQLTEPQTSRSGHSGSTITSSNALLQRCGKKKRTPIIWQIN